MTFEQKLPEGSKGMRHEDVKGRDWAEGTARIEALLFFVSILFLNFS